MGFRHAVLMCLLLLPMLATAAQPSVQYSSCLACHVSHYSANGSCNGCHGGNPGTSRKNIAHKNIVAGKYAYFNFSSSVQVNNGIKLIEQSGCRRCHVIFNQGNKAASSLDRLFPSQSPQNVDRAIKNPAQQMPDFHFTDTQRADIVNYLEFIGRKAGKQQAGENPQMVYFSNQKKKTENIFEKKCGGCHRMLTSEVGGMGNSDTGPNLSGLFSVFYPATIRGKQRWEHENLKKWLNNPRDIKPDSIMRPVVLSTDERVQLMQILRAQ